MQCFLSCRAPSHCLWANPVLPLKVQPIWTLASASFSLLACSSKAGEWGLLDAAPFSGSSPRLTNVGIELPTGATVCLDVTCSTERMKCNVEIEVLKCQDFYIKTEIISCLLLKSHILLHHCNCV